MAALPPDDDPVIFMESELLYGTKGEVEAGEVLVPFGEAEIVREGDDVTLVARFLRTLRLVLESPVRLVVA